MVILLVFAATLILAVMLSDLIQRSVLSTTVLFLAIGFLLGQNVFGLLPGPTSQTVSLLAQVALFTVLITDGMRTNLSDLVTAWHLPGRALLLGLPLALVFTALLAHWLIGLSWLEAFLLGAVLSPTDPVFAAAIVGRSGVPTRLRHLLNVESGLNDGLALPAVLILLDQMGSKSEPPLTILEELGLGVALGIAIPLVVLYIERIPVFTPACSFQTLNVIGIALVIYAAGSLLHANLFLAAFSAGVTIGSLDKQAVEAFQGFGETVTEVLKLLTVLLFASIISLTILLHFPWTVYLFALLALLLVRPLALVIALFHSRLDWREWTVAAWFGPKGFASILYGLLVLGAGAPRSNYLFHLVALVVVASLVLHSSTDVLAADWLQREDRHDLPDQPGDGKGGPGGNPADQCRLPGRTEGLSPGDPTLDKTENKEG